MKMKKYLNYRKNLNIKQENKVSVTNFIKSNHKDFKEKVIEVKTKEIPYDFDTTLIIMKIEMKILLLEL